MSIREGRVALSVGHLRGTHSRYVIGCCLIPLGICGLKNNSRGITYGIGCVSGMPSLSPLSSLGLILFQGCAFNKLQSNSALRVSFQGNMRVPGNVKCNRWYFKFNGNECSGPMTIDAIVYQDWSSGNPDLWHHRSFEGYCENIPQGAVRVELWVGRCHGRWAPGSTYTGWQSVSRIMIEEVSRSQS